MKPHIYNENIKICWGEFMELGVSKEEYLESVYVLGIKHGKVVRNVDLAHVLNVKKSSASQAIQTLIDMEYLYRGEDYELLLTSKGMELGERIYQRHQFWSRYLQYIGVDSKTAAKDAREMQHVLSDESFLKLKEHVMKEK